LIAEKNGKIAEKNFEKTLRTTAEKKSLEINTGFVAEKNGKTAEKVCFIAEKDFSPIVLD